MLELILLFLNPAYPFLVLKSCICLKFQGLLFVVMDSMKYITSCNRIAFVFVLFGDEMLMANVELKLKMRLRLVTFFLWVWGLGCEWLIMSND